MLDQANELFQQGILHYQNTEYQAALASWQQALHSYRNLKDRKREGAAWGNIGAVHEALLSPELAINCYQQHLDISREIQDPKGEMNALINLSNIYYNLGDYVNALEYQNQRFLPRHF